MLPFLEAHPVRLFLFLRQLHHWFALLLAC